MKITELFTNETLKELLKDASVLVEERDNMLHRYGQQCAPGAKLVKIPFPLMAETCITATSEQTPPKTYCSACAEATYLDCEYWQRFSSQWRYTDGYLVTFAQKYELITQTPVKNKLELLEQMKQMLEAVIESVGNKIVPPELLERIENKCQEMAEKGRDLDEKPLLYWAARRSVEKDLTDGRVERVPQGQKDLMIAIRASDTQKVWVEMFPHGKEWDSRGYVTKMLWYLLELDSNPLQPIASALIPELSGPFDVYPNACMPARAEDDFEVIEIANVLYKQGGEYSKLFQAVQAARNLKNQD